MPISVRIRGDFACFTRPEMKAERVSYDVITPSAARGVIEAVYWKPQIRWIVTRIQVLAPIRWMSVRRNEVASKIPARSVEQAMRAGSGRLGLDVEHDRQQRASTILRDVEYIVDARLEVLAASGTETKPEAKHLDQFNRRLASGQMFHRAYLGCREFPADASAVDAPIDEPAGAAQRRATARETARRELAGTIDLGYMLLDIDFPGGMTPLFFHAVMHDGVIDVPHPDVVRQSGAAATRTPVLRDAPTPPSKKRRP
jgi:CRISPR-associated protein Cas5d